MALWASASSICQALAAAEQCKTQVLSKEDSFSRMLDSFLMLVRSVLKCIGARRQGAWSRHCWLVIWC